jgi:hypothetical protein
MVAKQYNLRKAPARGGTMPQLRISLVMRWAALILALSTVSLTTAATIGHDHCHITIWSAASTTTIPGLPAQLVQGDNLVIGFTIPPPPPAPDPDCFYEISDLTFITISLTPAMNLTFQSGVVLGPGGLSGPLAPGGLTFTGGSADFEFPPHQEAGALEGMVGAGGSALTIGLIGIGQAINVTAVSAEISGHHYYVTVIPEPSTLVLLFAGALGLLACKIRSRSRFPDPQ